MIRVLVADDHPAIREIVREYLELFPEEFVVVGTAANGQQVVRLAHELQPDVVLMDVRMPILDGIEATRAIVGQGRQTRVITYTSFLYDDLRELALKAGAVEHLRKPFELDEVRQAVLAAARQKAAAAARARRWA